jgi:predicted dehydrogenase
MLAIDFESGVTATLATVRATPFYWRVHLFGTNGSAEVLDETTLVLRKSGSAPQRLSYEPVDTLAAELEAFADAIENKRAFPVSEIEVLATLSVFEAALQSMMLGNPVTCDAG